MKVKCILDVEGGHGGPLFICGKEYEADSSFFAVSEHGRPQGIIGKGQWFDSHFVMSPDQEFDCPHYGGQGKRCYMGAMGQDAPSCGQKPCVLTAIRKPEYVTCSHCKGLGIVPK